MPLASLLLIVLSLPFHTSAPRDGFQVIDISPAPNVLAADRETGITVTFSMPVNTATVDSTTFQVFGRWSGVMQGTFTIEEAGTRVRFDPARPFSAGEAVTVSLARRLAASDGEGLAKGFAWQFWTAARPANLDFVETGRLSVRGPGEDWVQAYGSFGGDLNGDDAPDLLVPNERTIDVRVFLNDGSGGYPGGYETYPIPGGGRPSPNEGADFNGDGHMDVAIGHSSAGVVSVFLGDGTGHLEGPVNYSAGDGVRGLAVLDLDGDGRPDLATANSNDDNVTTLRNEGDGFAEARLIDAPGARKTAAAAADVNGDGVFDLFVGALESREILVLLGDGQGGLTFHTKRPAGGAPWMIAAGDVNGDGHVDVVSANSEADNAAVLFGDGTGGLSQPVTYPTGGFPLAIDLGDLDGDGDLELVTSNFQGASWTVYENAGDGTLVRPRTLAAPLSGSCAVLHDRDGDGTLDLTGTDERSDELLLFTNHPTPAGTDEPPGAPAATLLPAYPNPFGTSTALPFRLSAPSTVRLIVTDVLGRAVRTLREGTVASGEHQLVWDGRDDAGLRVAPGLYFYTLQTPAVSYTRALLYVPGP